MSSYEERWQDKYERLEAFLATNGKLPRIYCPNAPEEQSLGTWMAGQRKKFQSGKLTVGQIAKLRALPVPGVIDKEERVDRLDELARFQRTHGRLPKSTAPEGTEEYRLAQFLIHYLRPKLKTGEFPRSQASRAARIPGAVMFSYTPDQDEKLEKLKAFIESTGYLPRSSRNAPAEELELARWVGNMLTRTPSAKNPQTALRVQEVHRLAVETPTYTKSRGRDLVDFLEAYAREHGNLPPTSGHKDPRYVQASNWLSIRRTNGDADDFGPDLGPRIKVLLSTIGSRDARWEDRLDQLVEYMEVNKKLPTGFHDGPVYHWLRAQRDQHRRGIMSTYREHVLRAIDGVLPPRRPGRRRKRQG